MTYSVNQFETLDTIKVYKTTFSSSVGSIYPLVPFNVSKSTNRFIPLTLIIHYDTYAGSFGSSVTYNLGYNSAISYSDYITSGAIDVVSRATNCVTIQNFVNANSNDLAISSSAQNVYFRFNSNPFSGQLTGTLCLVRYESYAD